MKQFLAPVRLRLWTGVVLALLSGLTGFVPLIAVSVFGAELIGERRSSVVWWAAGVGALGTIVSTAAYFTAVAVCHRADADFRFVTRERIARHIATVPLGWFLTGGSARVKRATSDDVSSVHTLIGHVIPDLAMTATAPVAAIVYLFIVDWRMAAVVIGYVLVVLVANMYLMQTASDRYSADYEQSNIELDRATVELVDGIAVAKAYGRRGRTMSRFDRSVDSSTRVTDQWVAAVGRPINLMAILLSPCTMLLVIVLLGAGFLGAGWIQVADLVPFIVVGVGLPASYMHLAQLGYPIQAAGKAAKSMAELLRVAPLPEPADPAQPADTSIAFQDVSFSYGDRTALRDVSFRLEPGSVTALVGPSGSGKSTIMQLIPRFYDALDGTVRVGGRDVRDLDHAELLASMSIVFQESVLIQGTIAENIRLNRPDATDAEVRAAADAAAVADEIEELPDGYATLVDGAALSGGQRQRVALARAILTDAPIVLLDEFTAHADPASEARIHRALSTLLGGKTVVAIAHRLHTIAGVDRILVVEDGRIVEDGTHDELLCVRGRYADLWASQEVPA